MKKLSFSSSLFLFVLMLNGFVYAEGALVSEATQECLDCHTIFHPGIVADWQRSRHAKATLKTALSVEDDQRRLTGKQIPEGLIENSVGCAECHTSRSGEHKDTFEHNGYDVHVVVSPDDCAVCHTTERGEFSENIMAMAEKNLSENTLYQDLQRTILGTPQSGTEGLHFTPANDMTRADACFYCHGTRLQVKGTEIRDTDAGELAFPVIEGWPNQGVGRINLDGSRGACSACHARHRFSIEVARKPYTCKECHVGPDVPAFKVYSASKHGAIFSSTHGRMNFTNVPWVIGEDIRVPTCATCHISKTVNADGEVINQRTHKMVDRLGWRIFGLVYAHPQPKSPDTTIIKNQIGLQLPTNLDGSAATEFLISPNEIASRRATMKRTCLACHDTAWVRGYFNRLDNTITVSNQSVRVATQLMESVWKNRYAEGLIGGGSLFDEYIERRWCDTWLLYANNIRFVSAMAGGGDYGVFEDGRYHLSKTIMELKDWMKARAMLHQQVQDPKAILK